jgi:hypothetical protein
MFRMRLFKPQSFQPPIQGTFRPIPCFVAAPSTDLAKNGVTPRNSAMWVRSALDRILKHEGIPSDQFRRKRSTKTGLT